MKKTLFLLTIILVGMMLISSCSSADEDDSKKKELIDIQPTNNASNEANATNGSDATNGSGGTNDPNLTTEQPDATTAPAAPITNLTDPIELTIDAEVEVYPFKPEMLGSNVGIWTESTYVPEADPRLLNMVKGAGMGVLRYPAGHEADLTEFDRTNSTPWHKGNTPYTRTMRADHLDAFIRLCKAVGAEPLIIVNAKIDNPEMAADIVRYLNVEHDHNVRYFEIGNEPQYWGDASGQEYAERYKRYTKAMKAVDPNITLLNAGPAQPVSINDWLLPVLEHAGDQVDMVNLHWYPLYDGVTDPNHAQYHSIDNLLTFDYGADSVIWDQIGSIKFTDRFVKTNEDSLINLREQYSPNALIGLTEVSPVAGGNAESGVSDTLANALWFGDILGRMAYNGVDLLTQFLLLSEPQKYAMADNSFNLRPVWYTYVMYARYFGDQLLRTASDNEQDLTIWASTRAGEDNLYVMVINKHLEEAKHATIQFNDFSPASKALSWVLTDESIDSLAASINGVRADEQVKLPDIPGIQVNDVSEQFQYTFPPHSITSFEFASYK